MKKQDAVKKGFCVCAAVLALLLAGCETSEPAETKEPVQQTNPATQMSTEEVLAQLPTAEPTEEPTEIPTEEFTEAPTEMPTEEPTEPEITFEPVEETVYATADVNIRIGPGVEYDRVRVLRQGKSIQRIGIGSNGWSKVLYNGEVYYISGKYLSTTAPEMPEENGSHSGQKPGEEEGFVHSYPLGSTVFYDLNGDGTEETITVNAQEYADGRLTVGDAAIDYSAVNPAGYFTIVNVDQSRNMLLVGISDYGFSDDDLTVLYAYDGKQIREAGFFGDILGKNSNGYAGAFCHGDGYITARVRMDILGTWTALGLYRMGESDLKDCTDVYQYVDWENRPGGWEVTTKVELPMYEDSTGNGNAVTIPDGTMVRMTGARKGTEEDTHWVCFEVDSVSKSLWLLTEEVDWQTYVRTGDGLIVSEEVFDGFGYAG